MSNYWRKTYGDYTWSKNMEEERISIPHLKFHKNGKLSFWDPSKKTWFHDYLPKEIPLEIEDKLTEKELKRLRLAQGV